MNSLTKIFFYLFFSILIGALVAPLAYWVIALFPVHDGFFSQLIHSIQQMPFHRYVSRSIQVTALILLWPLITSLKIQRLSDLYLYRNLYAPLDVIIGISVAIIPFSLLQLVFLFKGWSVFSQADFSFLLIPKILASAAIVAVFEEFFFRGVLLGLCRHVLKKEASIIFTALLFSGVHFLNLPHSNNETVHFWSGLALLLQAGSCLPTSPLLLGAFIMLFVSGIILAWVTVRTQSLFLAMGLHAAWIFTQQFFNSLTVYHVEPPNALFPWLAASQIHGMVPVGILPFFPLLITALLLKQWLKKRRKS